jgi:lantibiotic modifying enzyme
VLEPLTGFAHGAAGIAWALGELADLTGLERYRAAKRAAVAYERSLFSPEAKNWPDLRDSRSSTREKDGARANFVCARCHGATGIGIARILSLGRLDEPASRAEIEAALETTLAQGFGDNHSLSHGDLGSLEILLQLPTSVPASSSIGSLVAVFSASGTRQSTSVNDRAATKPADAELMTRRRAMASRPSGL